ncbi:hypothetical protein O6H91_06G030900 [Diphasiastrum complanatum]|uniref:Uncharacterized protein n=1 Tax=Diphasiastrum complanatum TaxID=34168 RepID=A0ACC2DC36_DIPCM|nr:hypothetical protein O6H91_06G030900 [Diphasiastrum complanatum]
MFLCRTSGVRWVTFTISIFGALFSPTEGEVRDNLAADSCTWLPCHGASSKQYSRALDAGASFILTWPLLGLKGAPIILFLTVHKAY